MNNQEGRPKTSRDFFRDLEKGAAISPNTTEEVYRAKKEKTETERKEKYEQATSLATSQNFRESSSFYRPSSEKIIKSSKGLKSLNLKKATPLAVIIGALAASLFVLFGSTSLLGAHLEALYTEATDTQYTSNTLRSTRLFSYMLTGGDQITTSWSGARKYKTFSPWLKSRLESNGIKVSNGALEFKGETITADNFSTTYRDNIEFREAYTNSKRGRVAGFFDDAAERIYQKLGLSRNIFEDYKQTGNDETDTAKYNETMAEQFKNDDLDVSTRTVDEEPVQNENGNPKIGEDGKPVTTKKEVASSGSSKAVEGSSATEKATSYFNKATAAVSTACGALKIGALLATTVSAVETYSAIHYFMNIMETPSKTKYGAGDEAATNQVNNFFMQPVTTSYIDAESGEEVSVTGSPLEGENERVILGGVKPDLEKASHYSFSRLSKVLTATMGTYGATAVACSVANAANAALSLATLAVPGSGFIKLTTSLLLDTAIKVGAQVAVTAALSFIIPTLARSLFENHFESLKGIPAGEAFGKGAAAANTQLAARGSGQSGASEDQLAAYSRQTAEVIAMDAELDQYTHSPFDASNKNTFLGSIVNSALSFATSTSLFGPIATLSNLTSSSLAKLSGAAYADSGLRYFDFYGDCPKLDEIGIKGDIYCSRITSTDTSTLDLAPDDATFVSVIEPNLETDEKGNEKIKDGSRLTKYINFCSERDSPWGVYDASIAASFETSLGPLDALPYLGDGITIINAIETLNPEVELWATGRICNNTSDNPYWESEMKYYQRYLEDNRILSQFGVFKDEEAEDPVLAYKEQYEAAHPADNSREGILARITGSPKEDIETMLAVVDYYNFLSTYHPEERYAFTGEAKDTINTDGTLVQQANNLFTNATNTGGTRGRGTQKFPYEIFGEGERVTGPVFISRKEEITA
ncbi:hypothetical protein IJ114_01230 [Candidatus Saccharibacteria bacterium]|nr:hypothetical protein [Candidatus Saccharibacteria bacterium]